MKFLGRLQCWLLGEHDYVPQVLEEEVWVPPPLPGFSMRVKLRVLKCRRCGNAMKFRA